jgi:Ca2+-binding RTX toxin-like protein
MADIVVQASNIKVTAIQAGADNIFEGPGDDTYIRIGGDLDGSHDYSIIKSNGQNAINGMFTGETGKVSPITVLGGQVVNHPLTGRPTVTFELRDFDNRPFQTHFDFFDTPLLRTSYTGTGKEPLVGTVPDYWVNISEMNGSKYKLEYNINRFSTSGKVASAKGGVMDGRNTDGTMVGLGGKDTINGNNGDDVIFGGGNTDNLNGGDGDDVIFGGAGKDRSTGGNGSDTFVIAHNSGFDTITDFRVGKDHIGLADGLAFQDLSFSAWQRGTLVKAGNEKLAWLDGVKPNQLSASSFVQSDLAGINSLVNANLATIKAS